MAGVTVWARNCRWGWGLAAVRNGQNLHRLVVNMLSNADAFGGILDKLDPKQFDESLACLAAK